MNPQNGAGSNGRSDDGDDAAKPAKRTQQQHHEQEQEQEQETAQQQQDEETPSQFQSLIQRDLQTHSLDSYPYAFSPLLLFTSNGYFDKGHSNYNAVAAFFDGALSDLLRGGGLGGEEEGNGDADTRRDVDMLEGVVYDRKNMTYDELYNHIVDTQSIVTCCIDAHFTAFQILSPKFLLYYDPMNSSLRLVRGESQVQHVALYFLLKCNYGDNVHVQENKNYYVGNSSSELQLTVYRLWKKINTLNLSNIPAKWISIPLNLDKYLFINCKSRHCDMSTQLTGNTCYFQTYLFALLCKVGRPSISPDGRSIDLRNPDLLEKVTIRIARFLLTFFFDSQNQILRPLTNSNFVLDFFRYRSSPYFTAFAQYLEANRVHVPDYDRQYEGVTKYYVFTKSLHGYDKFALEGATSSTPNTKSLQYIHDSDGASRKLGRGNYYKYRAVNLMFGCNAGAMLGMSSFCEFNSWRKNQLLSFYDKVVRVVNDLAYKTCQAKLTKYRDYYFMPQFEVGQQELIDVHFYTYLIDMVSIGKAPNTLTQIVHNVNSVLVQFIHFSTQHRNNYDKMMSLEQFMSAKKYKNFFAENFLSAEWFSNYIGLGFSEINPKEKDINSLTQTVFYDIDLMRSQAHRQEFAFEKECINQMARSNLRRFTPMFDDRQNASQKYDVAIKIGHGYTYSKYNTLMHFLNVVECYWQNPDVNNIQILGKDIRTLLVLSCQKIFFEPSHHGYYYYGPFLCRGSFRTEFDLAVASASGSASATVSHSSRNAHNNLVVTDRVYEYSYLKGIVERLFRGANGIRFKSDNAVLNLILLSLLLDFGLFDQYAKLLNIPFMKDLQHEADTRELQVEVANLIYNFDRKHTEDSITRSKVEELIYEVSYKFFINKNFPINSSQFRLIQMLNGDPDYQEYVLLCKIYMSLCQINKSIEVDYYKIRCNGQFHIIIPKNFSKTTSEYLEQVTVHHSFSEANGIMMYDDINVFDLRPGQPEINLYRVRLESNTDVQSMVKYLEITNVFRTLSLHEQYLIFIADNSILIDVIEGGKMEIRINKVSAEVSTIFFNEALSFIPCFKYSEGEDIIIFTSRNIHYFVDKGGQFCTDYYGMKHELIECIKSEEVFVDLNDDVQFRKEKLSDLLTESKVVVYFPDYLLLVSNRQQLINLLDYAIYIRNIGFFILVLFFLRRTSIHLEYIERKEKVVLISGPWREAIVYVLNIGPKNPHYDRIFEKQFFDVNQHANLPLSDFIEVLCENFTRYQRYTEDGQYQIIPTEKQKQFLERIICGEESFHFSEVGTGKTKVIMPLLCQTFLSSNIEAHRYLARGGKQKDTLVILVPEHLVPDARHQVFKHCLNLNFRQEYRVYDDIFALLHPQVHLGANSGESKPRKQIFVISFNQFKKALTYDNICQKVRPHREHILVIADEVDDFLDRDKLVFNICSNKANTFAPSTLELYYETSCAAYHRTECPRELFQSSPNPGYWMDLYEKFVAIHNEIQDASKSLNKNFGIFNEQTLRHCTSSISHDIEGYKALIARPYESVNRAMPGSYYSDVERTIFLTFVILSEDIAKYDELFQGERKFITFEYWRECLTELDYDELVYGHNRLSEIAENHPSASLGLIRFLYIIILKRMEIRDRSRSVNSVDIIFNFDCIGFTGTPFLDNYPTSDYIRHQREDDIPPSIDRSFYAYTSEELSQDEFENRFSQFQGQNSDVKVEYVSSDFMQESLKVGEMETLKEIFTREQDNLNAESDMTTTAPFNAIVDLCGIFKLSTIEDVRSLVLEQFGPDSFHYIYHIDQSDGSDRMLCIKSKNDVTFDEEFYRDLCKSYGADLRQKIFFFVDNRNYIGKDVPYQLIYQRHFKLPLFVKSVVIAHDVEDFSKIWQAMGRSRTMNDTTFSIYKSNIPAGMIEGRSGLQDIKTQPLTKLLYTKNCDCKMAGNLSSIYQTLIALYNLSQDSFYYSDDIVNSFIEKMEMTIQTKVKTLEDKISRVVLGTPVPARILEHIFLDKFRRSPNKTVATAEISHEMVNVLVRQIVEQKFEQRYPSGDIYDDYIKFLSGEQESLMEISYTKQQQKQKQKQKAKSQDNDTMDIFDKKNQLTFTFKTDNYLDMTKNPSKDEARLTLSLPISVPIFEMQYFSEGRRKAIQVYPTVQFLYSHHILGNYIAEEVHRVAKGATDPQKFCADFVSAVFSRAASTNVMNGVDPEGFYSKVVFSYVKQHPQYTMVGIQPGVYIIGMKDQFNTHDCEAHPLNDILQYAADEVGFILFDKTNTKSIDEFGPYFLEQYLLLDALSKHEVAQNVINYYCKHKDKLQHCLDHYDEKQGKGFICWRFLMNQSLLAEK